MINFLKKAENINTFKEELMKAYYGCVTKYIEYNWGDKPCKEVRKKKTDELIKALEETFFYAVTDDKVLFVSSLLFEDVFGELDHFSVNNSFNELLKKHFGARAICAVKTEDSSYLQFAIFKTLDSLCSSLDNFKDQSQSETIKNLKNHIEYLNSIIISNSDVKTITTSNK